jgi:ABC-type branched-subunit amino acid transport system substrate-binding protein
VPQVVQLVGSSGWHHPGLLPRGGPAVEGALIVEVYAGGDDEDYASEDAARFAEAFRSRTGRLPTQVTAQAYDAATLVFDARERAAASRAPSRAAMTAALAGARLTAGACGPAAIDRRGAIARDPILVRVDGGGFVLHEY